MTSSPKPLPRTHAYHLTEVLSPSSPSSPSHSYPHLSPLYPPVSITLRWFQSRPSLLFVGWMIGVFTFILGHWIWHHMQTTPGASTTEALDQYQQLQLASTSRNILNQLTTDEATTGTETLQHACPTCPTCPIPAAPIPFVQEKCHDLSDQPPHSAPIHHQSSYGSIPTYPIDCRDWASRGKWVERTGPFPKWVSIDRWGMFGPNGREQDVKYVFQPPEECRQKSPQDETATFRSFNAKKFIETMAGKTISFYGDSIIRQQYGMLTLLLDDYMIGHSLYYKRHSKYLDAVREMYLQNNITIKNQWITGHNHIESMVRDAFPTIWRSDLIVTNIGAFYQPGREADLDLTLRYFLDYTKKNYQGSIMWREYAPTHFETPDGEFLEFAGAYRGRPCVSYDPTDPKTNHTARFNNYRVTVANAVMKEYHIPIIHIFNTSTIIPDGHLSHPGNGDCRHWFNPSSVLEHWSDIFYNMVVPRE